MKNKNFAQEYLKFIKTNKKATWDDFFDNVEIPKKLRGDFLIGCILKQAKELANI